MVRFSGLKMFSGRDRSLTKAAKMPTIQSVSQSVIVWWHKLILFFPLQDCAYTQGRTNTHMLKGEDDYDDADGASLSINDLLARYTEQDAASPPPAK